MNVRPVFFALLFLPLAAFAQGYAGLGNKSADGFQSPRPNHALQFPVDHAAHPDFRIEWWYLTANLQSDAGTELGIQWTLFRSAASPQETNDWTSPQFWLAHAAVTTKASHHFAEKRARGGIGQAGVTLNPFGAWIDDWSMQSTDNTLQNLQIRASSAEFSYDLTLAAQGPLVRHGDDGYSVKSEDGQASYYYSQPHYQISGTVTINGKVHSVSGTGWLDREWSSQPLASDQSGWDWFSLSFEDGSKLMGFVLRGARGNFTSGSWISADSQLTPLNQGEFNAFPLAYESEVSENIPTRWKVKLANKGLDITVAALNPNAWLETSFNYWEGPVHVTGSHAGHGYLEMTGYDALRD